jgi:alpha-amylase
MPGPLDQAFNAQALERRPEDRMKGLKAIGILQRTICITVVLILGGECRAGVMMQGFYWDCPEGWYAVMTEKAEELCDMRGGQGIDRMWFPAPQKSHSGRYSMGYDPYDYYDLGQYDQQGTTATRFGTQEDLRRTLALYRSKKVACMADIILNHRSGGKAESNPRRKGESTWTDFSGVASGQCTWRYDQFHPSTHEKSDPGAFGDFPDICHVTGDRPGCAGYDLIEWGNWLTEPAHAGFDGGWRLDYVKGVHPAYLGAFIKGTGNAYAILECWDDITVIEEYLDESGCAAAFDFPAFYTMVQVFNHGEDIDQLVDSDKVFAAGNPDQAVTFVANHDTDKDAHVESVTHNTMLAYAFILTYQGYPCIFWKDYFDYGLAAFGGQPGNGIKPLVWVREALGGGEPEIERLKADGDDLLVYGTLNGHREAPGYIVAINNHPHKTLRAKVSTDNDFLRGKKLSCHAWYSYVQGENRQPEDISCRRSGNIELQVAPRGYAVYSVSTELLDASRVPEVE